jgi:hypothetical protein
LRSTAHRAHISIFASFGFWDKTLPPKPKQEYLVDHTAAAFSPKSVRERAGYVANGEYQIGLRTKRRRR